MKDNETLKTIITALVLIVLALTLFLILRTVKNEEQVEYDIPEELVPYLIDTKDTINLVGYYSNGELVIEFNSIKE